MSQENNVKKINDEEIGSVAGGEGEDVVHVQVSCVVDWTCTVCGYKISSRYQDLPEYCPGGSKNDKFWGIKHKANWE